MHANAGNHLHGGITDNIVWQGWWRDLAVMPSHCYDAPSGKVGLQFVGDLKSELCGVRGRRWNSERFIVFQTVILQRDFHVTASHTIRRCIKKRLDAWDDGIHRMLVDQMLRTYVQYLTASRMEDS